MDSRGRMQHEHEDDIDVLSNGDTQNITDEAIEPLIDIRSAQRQQLFYSNAGNLEDNAASLHSLKLSYDALKKRYNELEIKNQTMQKVITEIESERLSKDRLNPRVSLTGGDAAGPAASAFPDAGTAEGSLANNVKAHLGYAQRLERQILRLQMTMEEQTQKFRKDMEGLHNANEHLKKLLIEKDEEIRDLKEKNAKLAKEIELKEGHIKSVLQEQQRLCMSVPQSSEENESYMLIDNGKILRKIQDQNKVIQELHKQVQEQRQMIEDQTNIVRKVVDKAKASGVSLSSSIMDLSRRIDGSSMSASYNDPQALDPSSPRSYKYSVEQPNGQNIRTSQFRQFSNYPKSAISSSSSTGRNMSAPTLQSDHHDGNILQSSIMSKTWKQGGISSSLLPPLHDSKNPTQTGARPKVGSSPRTLEFSPLVDDFSMNPDQITQDDVGKNSNVNVLNYGPTAAVIQNSNRNKLFAPNFLRQGEITSKQPQQNTEIVDSNKIGIERADAQTHNDFARKQNNWDGNTLPQISVSPQRIENSLPTTSDNLFGTNGQRIEDRPVKVPQQNEELLFNPPDQIVENDYVNVLGNNDIVNTRVSQETGGQGNVQNSDNRCPVCSQEFPGMDMQEFQMHVLHCIDDSNDEPQTIQNQNRVDSNNRICPMCDAVFPSELPQEEFENHVQEHFGEERFEVLQT